MSQTDPNGNYFQLAMNKKSGPISSRSKETFFCSADLSI
jgi:hypothetical protein